MPPFTPWRRRVAEHDWMCECGCIPTGLDITVARSIIRTDQDEIERLRKLLDAAGIKYEENSDGLSR